MGLFSVCSLFVCGQIFSFVIVQYSTVQYCTVHDSTVQYSILQYSTVQYSTVQYSTVQYSTVQYITVQYSIYRPYSKFRLDTTLDNIEICYHAVINECLLICGQIFFSIFNGHLNSTQKISAQF